MGAGERVLKSWRRRKQVRDSVCHSPCTTDYLGGWEVKAGAGLLLAGTGIGLVRVTEGGIVLPCKGGGGVGDV